MMNIVADGRRARLREQWEGKAQHGQHDVLNRSTAWGRHRFSPGLQSHSMVSMLATTRTHFCSARSAFWVTGALRCDCQSNGGNDNGGRLFCLRIFLKSRNPNKISDQGKFRPVGWPDTLDSALRAAFGPP